MDKLLQAALTNYKSSLAGLVILGVTVALVIGRISTEDFLKILGVAGGLGLLAAKDATKP